MSYIMINDTNVKCVYDYYKYLTLWHNMLKKSDEFTVYFQENIQDQEQVIFDEDHKCIILDVGTYIAIVL